jgi:DNA repair protein RecO (recombination protein O)
VVDWSDDGVILAVRKHGEAAAIVSLLTQAHGRHAGLVRGGAGRRQRGVLQPGNEVRAAWRARLADHLGSYTLEPTRARIALLLDWPDRLAGLAAACAVVEVSVPEREPHPALYAGFGALLDALFESEAWPAVYVRFELGLLQELGFGLDLSRCAVTGGHEGLAFVSPRSGRAVSAAAAAPWKERLLPLPGFLLGTQAGGLAADDLQHGLALTGHFLERHVLAPSRKPLPGARARLVEQFAKLATRSSAIVPK